MPSVSLNRAESSLSRVSLKIRSVGGNSQRSIKTSQYILTGEKRKNTSTARFSENLQIITGLLEGTNSSTAPNSEYLPIHIRWLESTDSSTTPDLYLPIHIRWLERTNSLTAPVLPQSSLPPCIPEEQRVTQITRYGPCRTLKKRSFAAETRPHLTNWLQPELT